MFGKASDCNGRELYLDTGGPRTSTCIEGYSDILIFVVDEDSVEAAPVVLHLAHYQLEQHNAK